jgi:hypothetical protein
MSIAISTHKIASTRSAHRSTGRMIHALFMGH